MEFLNEQCKKQRKRIEWERLDLSKKNGDIKETFHARIGIIKDKTGKDLTEAEEIKERWQECTEELYKKAYVTLENL